MKLKIYILTLFLIACNRPLDRYEYKKMLDQSQLLQHLETDSFSYSMTLLPPKFKALQSDFQNQKDFDNLVKDFSSDWHFHLLIEDKFPDRLYKSSNSMYYLSDFQQEFSLNSADSVSYFHHEAGHFKGRESFLFGIPNKNQASISILIRTHMNDANLSFDFPTDEIIRFNQIDIK